jgi:hypothetical protein
LIGSGQLAHFGDLGIHPNILHIQDIYSSVSMLCICIPAFPSAWSLVRVSIQQLLIRTGTESYWNPSGYAKPPLRAAPSLSLTRPHRISNHSAGGETLDLRARSSFTLSHMPVLEYGFSWGAGPCNLPNVRSPAISKQEKCWYRRSHFLLRVCEIVL